MGSGIEPTLNFKKDNFRHLFDALTVLLNAMIQYLFCGLCHKYLHFSKTSLDEPLDVHLCSHFHEQHCVTRRDVIQT